MIGIDEVRLLYSYEIKSQHALHITLFTVTTRPLRIAMGLCVGARHSCVASRRLSRCWCENECAFRTFNDVIANQDLRQLLAIRNRAGRIYMYKTVPTSPLPSHPPFPLSLTPTLSPSRLPPPPLPRLRNIDPIRLHDLHTQRQPSPTKRPLPKNDFLTLSALRSGYPGAYIPRPSPNSCTVSSKLRLRFFLRNSFRETSSTLGSRA